MKTGCLVFLCCICLAAQDLSFTPAGSCTVASFGGPTGLMTADFTGTGRQDVLFLNAVFGIPNGEIAVLLRNADGSCRPPVRTTLGFSDPPFLYSFAVADFNGDGKADVAYKLRGSGVVLLLTGNGDGSFASAITIAQEVPNQNGEMTAVDVNGDGKPDLVEVVETASTSDLVVRLGNGKGAFLAPIVTPLSTFLTRKAFSKILAADFDGDGFPDVVIAEGSAILFLRGKGDGTFGTPTLVSGLDPSFTTNSMGAGDFDGDGNLDLAVMDGIHQVSTLRGNGDGTFQSPRNISGILDNFVLGDFNGDGRTDIASRFTLLSGQTILLGAKDGTFQDAGPFPMNGLATAGDFNGDGKLDLAFNGALDTVSFLLNTTKYVSVANVLDAASLARNQAVAPGSLVAIFGAGLAASTATASSIPLPFTLGGVSVKFNGIAAPLLYVSGRQINAQLPWNVGAGAVGVVVTNGVSSQSVNVTMAPVSAGIYTLSSGTGQAIALNSDGTLADSTHPAHPGDTVILYASGLGAVTPPVDNGSNSIGVLRYAVAQPKVLIGGASAAVSFAGLSPQFVGVYQVNAVVPAAAGTGDEVPVQLVSGGVTTTGRVTLAIR